MSDNSNIPKPPQPHSANTSDPSPASCLTCGEEGFVRNHTTKKTGSHFSLTCAFSCAWAGFIHVVRTQRNMKVHLFFSVLAIILGFVCALDGASWAAIIICIAIVFAAECFNTALEAVVDLVSPQYHDLARYAKDCAAAAVLVCALATVVVALVVFSPRLIALLGY